MNSPVLKNAASEKSGPSPRRSPGAQSLADVSVCVSGAAEAAAGSSVWGPAPRQRFGSRRKAMSASRLGAASELGCGGGEPAVCPAKGLGGHQRWGGGPGASSCWWKLVEERRGIRWGILRMLGRKVGINQGKVGRIFFSFMCFLTSSCAPYHQYCPPPVENGVLMVVMGSEEFYL